MGGRILDFFIGFLYYVTIIKKLEDSNVRKKGKS